MNIKKVGKWIGISLAVLLIAYVGQVIAFEVRLGVNQPENQSTIVIATFDDNHNRHERVVRLVEIDGKPYIAANHWPRSWYRQALENPDVQVKMEDRSQPFRAVPLEGEEEARVRDIYTVDFAFRFRTGFPPRHFMRLEPRFIILSPANTN